MRSPVAKRKNPLTGRYVIAARRTKSSPRLFFTGKALDNTDPPRVFTRWKSAVLAARALERRYPHIIGRYYVSIESYKGHPGRKRNPSPRDSMVREAAERFAEFSGHDPETTQTIDVKVPPVMLAVGELDGLLYTTVRDHKREAYIHKFKKSARPLLAASHDGRSLSIVGGRFEFTEAGIEDR
jgi:hypothetical protein